MKLDLPIDSVNTVISALQLSQASINNALNLIAEQTAPAEEPSVPKAATVPAELSSAE